MRCRILCLLPDLNGGGAERMMLYLVRNLARERYDITLALGLKRGPYLPIVPTDISFVELGHERAADSVWAIARLFRRGSFDLCFSMVSMNLAAVLAREVSRSRLRLVLGARNHYSRSLPAEATGARFKMLAIRALYPRADLVIGVSKGVTGDLYRNFGIPKCKLRAIHNPIDIERVRTLAVEPLEHEWLQPSAKIPVLVAVGKLQPAKGYPDLLRAFRLVRDNTLVRLVVLGQGPDQPELEALVGQLGLTADVRFVGFDVNPYRWLARAAVFVHAAHWEGFPNVLVEAMAAGAPVVSTDCPSGPAEIITDGENGFLVPVGDVVSHSTRIRELLSDSALRTRIVGAADRRVEDFAVMQIVRQYAGAFEEVLQSGS